MNREDLLQKIDSIEELPLDEEMLGAFAEGNLSKDEYAGVLSALEYDENISSLYNEAIPSPDEIFFPEDEWPDYENIDTDNIFEEEINIDDLNYDTNFDDFNLEMAESDEVKFYSIDHISLPDIEEYCLGLNLDGDYSNASEDIMFSWITGIGDCRNDDDLDYFDSFQCLDADEFSPDSSISDNIGIDGCDANFGYDNDTLIDSFNDFFQ